MNIDIISIPKIQEPRGNLSVIESDVIPFEIKRVYYLYDVPAGAERGGHAHQRPGRGIQHQELLLRESIR